MFHSVSSIENIHWENLPFVPLVLIFKFLENRDRLNASLACQNWYNAFECGILWERFNLVFHGDMIDDTRKAVKFVKKHAASLKHLSIQFRRINMIPLQDGINNLKQLFEHLEDSCQLHDFHLENFFHPQQGNLNRTLNTRPTVDAFKAFVKSQRNLKRINFFNVRLSEKDGLDILTEIASKNESLQSLGLTHFLEGTADAHKYVRKFLS
ncbi:hypothetical protein AVEN_19443-1 [Araneus ventricosus]|uniref:F-box domain-containing protein n=1 Tax=Araneus ventricosus TaxID=182803 RepID=A0A4Y2C685_ARAVE|nr:hypothetical protein AVEN_19443-1 [Araneus ventricosus]